jgi:hypothetical protein
MTVAALLPALAAVLISTSGNALQEGSSLVVRGRVIGPDNSALAGQAVVLHKVAGATGTTVAESVTDADGRFELSTPALGDTTAIYFIAARYEGELYIGAPFREAEEEARNQVLQVGVAGTSATAMLEGSGALPQASGRPLTSRSWLLFAIPLLGVAAVAVYALLRRGRLPHDRVALIRLAELDERATSAPAGQRDALMSERARLLGELRRS